MSEPSFLEPYQGGWRFLKSGEDLPSLGHPRNMPAGAVLVNEPWNFDWVAAVKGQPVEWSIYLPPDKTLRWGIPDMWARRILDAAGASFSVRPP